MSLGFMANNPFVLNKPDGRQTPFSGRLADNKRLITFDMNLDVEDNDVAERTLPNGKIERFRILDTGFNSGLHGIPASFQMRVEKVGAGVPSRSGGAAVTHHYHAEGPNARINLHSVDSSHNVANAEEKELFEKIRDAITAGVANAAQRDQMLGAVDEIEASAGTSKLAEGFRGLMAVSADAMTILLPFIPVLTKLASDGLK